jgi:hypothetical protein
MAFPNRFHIIAELYLCVRLDVHHIQVTKFLMFLIQIQRRIHHIVQILFITQRVSFAIITIVVDSMDY